MALRNVVLDQERVRGIEIGVADAEVLERHGIVRVYHGRLNGPCSDATVYVIREGFVAHHGRNALSRVALLCAVPWAPFRTL